MPLHTVWKCVRSSCLWQTEIEPIDNECVRCGIRGSIGSHQVDKIALRRIMLRRVINQTIMEQPNLHCSSMDIISATIADFVEKEFGE